MARSEDRPKIFGVDPSLTCSIFQRETATRGPEGEDRGREAHPARRVQAPDPEDKEESGSSREIAAGQTGEKHTFSSQKGQPNYVAVPYHGPSLRCERCNTQETINSSSTDIFDCLYLRKLIIQVCRKILFFTDKGFKTRLRKPPSHT